MAKAAKTSTPAYEVLSGALHKDHWIGQRVSLRLRPEDQARNIRITLWNPIYNSAYLNNLVGVRLDGRSVFSEKLQPAASAVIEYALDAGEDLRIQVESAACLVPDALDPRERGIIVKLTQEPAS